MEMQFLNSNSDVEVISDKKQEYYENYYLAHTPEAGITAHSFTKLTYKNLWPNIDLILECSPNQSARHSGLEPEPQPNSLEYSFILHPGANIKDIQLQWNGL